MQPAAFGRCGDRDGERRALRIAASVFSENLGRAMRSQPGSTSHGVVNENLFPLSPELPHGGFKESGYGKDMSIYSMEEYTASSTWW